MIASGAGANLAAITPSNTDNLANECFIRVGTTAGDLKVDAVGSGSGIVITNVQIGETIPCKVKKVYATGTTAVGLIGIW